MSQKIPYVCGPLTELPCEVERTKDFYTEIGDLFKDLIGERAFVPHEHFDPIEHALYTPREVDHSERYQICHNTSLLIVVAIAPSWGGGIEVEIANQNDVPVIILHSKNKRVSRLLRGNPAVRGVIEYIYYSEAINKLREWYCNYFSHKKICQLND